MKIVIAAIIAGIIIVAGCAGNRPLPVQPGISIPAASTASGRASLLNDLIGHHARINRQVVHGAMKGEWDAMLDLSDRERVELDDTKLALTAAQADRQDLINQVIEGKHDQIDIKARGDAALAKQKEKFDAEHARLKYLGWWTWMIIHIIEGSLIAGAVLWFVWGVYSGLNPASWLAKLFFRNAPAAGPFMRMAGVDVQLKA